jgi:thiol-disulfide isomerase/thioredoxin
MTHKTFAMTGAAILALTAPIALAVEEWTMDFAAAQKAAAGNNKDLFLEFTGSDWCPPCKMLNSEVFSKKEFLTAAAEHFVLVKLDFPKNEASLTDEIRSQNEELAEKYDIEGFPTVLLCDAQGRPYAATGYREGGVQPYLEHLAELRESRTKRDAALQAATAAEGVEKAKALAAALNGMELEFSVLQKFYGDEIAAIKANDPDDQSGFVKKSVAQESLAAFIEQVNAHAGQGNFQGILPLVDEMLKVEGLEPVERQQITLTRASVFAQLGRFDDAIQVVDEAAKIAPESEVAQYLDGFKAELAEARDAAAKEKAEGGE